MGSLRGLCGVLVNDISGDISKGGGEMRSWKTIAVLLAGLFCAGSAQAGVIFTVKEVGADLQIKVSGSINTSGWSMQSITPSNPFLRQDSIAVGTGPMQRVDGPTQAVSGGASNTAVFPTLGWGYYQPVAGSATGSLVHFQQNGFGGWILYLPANYVSGSPLSGSAVYANLSYASLGIVKNQTYWTWHLDGIPGSDAKSVTVWATPEPASMAMWGIGAAGAAFVRRRRRISQPS